MRWGWYVVYSHLDPNQGTPMVQFITRVADREQCGAEFAFMVDGDREVAGFYSRRYP